MKKFVKIFICFMLVITLCGCGSKKALSKDKMNSKLYSLGFDVYDVSDKIEDKSVKTLLSANYRGNFQIEYYEFKNKDDAKKVFDADKKELIKSNGDKGKTKEGSNYDRFVQQISDKYAVVTRIDNTLIYVFANVDYKKDIKSNLKKIGYY